MHNQNYCPCGSLKSSDHCCEPFIKKAVYPETPEDLMRSRYSAYVFQNYDYILATYTKDQQSKLNEDALKQAAQDTKWLGLNVLSSFAMENEGEVEFIAFYKIKNQCYQMHEHSYFLYEDGQWKYDKGEMLHKTGKINVSRNQPCICGSGLKYKRCCYLR